MVKIPICRAEQGLRALLFRVNKKSPGGGCRRGKISIYKVLDFAAEGFGEADHHTHLGFAQVILFLLIKLHHTQGNARGVTELLLGKATGFPDGVQLGFTGFLVPADDGICGYHELRVVRFVVNIHGEYGGEGQSVCNDILEPSAALPLVVSENPTGPILTTFEIWV